jgi:thiol-disulfide isomerase/thioredoxin
MEGYWKVNYRDNYRIKFKAFHGDSTRFLFVKNDIPADYNGRWQSKFSEGTADEYPAVIDLIQNGSFLTGTILTETGDYRYLHGNVAGSKAWLSCFDGSHAFLFEMKIDERKNMIGLFRSGKHHQEPFSAIKNPNAKLIEADALVGLNKSNNKFVINHPNEKGDIIKSTEGKYQGKVKVIEVMGTWCPNCKDATVYLKKLKEKMPDVEIIAMAFERYRDSKKSLDQLKKYKEQMDLPYEIVLGGYYDKKEASTSLPQIEKVMAYPTLLLVDGNDRLVKVFTGFYGPATKEYKGFTQKIETAINSL